MQGSLDNPPLVVSTARWKALLLLVISVVFVVTGVLELSAAAQDWWTYLQLAVFGPACAVFVWQLFSPASLTIAPGGVTYRGLWHARHFEWWQVADFRPVAFGMLSKHVLFDLRKARDGEARPGGFGTGWELPAARLCDLLNQARERWNAP